MNRIVTFLPCVGFGRRKLLREIKQNQEHQSPQSLANNFYLIRELNGNIEKVGCFSVLHTLLLALVPTAL